jgi:hypothetical protein
MLTFTDNVVFLSTGYSVINERVNRGLFNQRKTVAI